MLLSLGKMAVNANLTLRNGIWLEHLAFTIGYFVEQQLSAIVEELDVTGIGVNDSCNVVCFDSDVRTGF